MRNVRQDSSDYVRRWFFDDHFDLIAFYNPDGTIHGFQLCYDKPDDEKALTWYSDRGLSHHAVDTGEQTPWVNRSPMFAMTDGRARMPQLLAAFSEADAGVPDQLASLVVEKIGEYGRRAR